MRPLKSSSVSALFVSLVLVATSCTSSSEPTTIPPTSTTALPPSTTTTRPPPESYGDDAELDRLWDACAAEDFGSCDVLLARSEPGSDYEVFAATCGERSEPLEDELCADVFASLGVVGVGEGETIDLAALQFLTVDIATDQLRGIELAIEDYGPIVDRNVELVAIEDEGCDTERAASSAVALASMPNLVGVIGTTCSNSAIAAIEILSEAGMVMIGATISDPSLTSDLRGTVGSAWFPGFHRRFYNDLRFSTASANFMASELSLDTVAVVHEAGNLGWAVDFETELADLGGETILIEVEGSPTDLRPLLTEIERSSPDGIFLTVNRQLSELFVQQVVNSDLAELPLLIGNQADEGFLAIPETEGVYFAKGVYDFPGAVGFEGITLEQLTADYRRTYGERPAVFINGHAYAYDATILLLSAIEAVAVDEGGTVIIDRRDLRDWLTATEGMAGVTGTITCDEFGDCGQEAIDFIQNTRPDRPELGFVNVVWTYPPASDV